MPEDQGPDARNAAEGDTRAKIMAAAIEVFGCVGYSAASARVPPRRLSEAAAIANARSRNTWPRTSCKSCTRVTQSIAFLTSAGTEELYSGVTITTP